MRMSICCRRIRSSNRSSGPSYCARWTFSGDCDSEPDATGNLPIVLLRRNPCCTHRPWTSRHYLPAFAAHRVGKPDGTGRVLTCLVSRRTFHIKFKGQRLGGNRAGRARRQSARSPRDTACRALPCSGCCSGPDMLKGSGGNAWHLSGPARRMQPRHARPG